MWFSNEKTKYSFLIMLVDALIINLSIILAYLIRFKFSLPEFNFKPYTDMFIWITMGGLFFLNSFRLYSVSARTRWDDQFYSIVFTVVLTLMLSISLTYISANYAFPRTVFVLSGFIQVVLLLTWRYFLWQYTKKRLGVERAIVVGGSLESFEIIEKINKFSDNHLEFVGFITQEKIDTYINKNENHRILGSVDEFEGILGSMEYDVVILVSQIDTSIKEKIVCYCYSRNKAVMLIPDLYEVLLIKAGVHLIDDIPFCDIRDESDENNPLKRTLDMVVSTLGLVILLPLLIVLGIVIKLDSVGPAIYKQERVTRGGKSFILYKFRTMIQDAEKGIPVFAVEDDQRTTRTGRFLRLSRLDELPQLFNVLKGDMSLVGPRPERPFFVEQFSQQINGYENRHKIKPGITGVAQVAGKYNTGPREKLVFDLLYAKKNNIMVDMQILLQTIKVIFMKDKAS